MLARTYVDRVLNYVLESCTFRAQIYRGLYSARFAVGGRRPTGCATGISCTTGAPEIRAITIRRTVLYEGERARARSASGLNCDTSPAARTILINFAAGILVSIVNVHVCAYACCTHVIRTPINIADSPRFVQQSRLPGILACLAICLRQIPLRLYLSLFTLALLSFSSHIIVDFTIFQTFR